MPVKDTLQTLSCCLHKASGQAVVTLGGKVVYLGKYGANDSRAAYDRTIAEWLANGRRLRAPHPIGISLVMLPPRASSTDHPRRTR